MVTVSHRTASKRGGANHRRVRFNPRQDIIDRLQEAKAKLRKAKAKGGTKHKGTGPAFTATVSFGSTGSASVTVSINNYDNLRHDLSVYAKQQAAPNGDPDNLLAYSANHPVGSQLGSDLQFTENQAFYVELYFYRGTGAPAQKFGVTIAAADVKKGTEQANLTLNPLPLP